MRFAKHPNVLRACLLTLFGCMGLVPGCGVNDTTTPAQGVYYPLPPEAAIKDEFFIGVRPSDSWLPLKDPMQTVREHLGCLYAPPPAGKPCDTSVPVTLVGCGGTTDPHIYEHPDLHLFCMRLPHPDADIASLLRLPEIAYVEAHGRLVSAGVQVCPDSWGLDQIDQSIAEPRNGVYAYKHTGNGVHVYLIDSGISTDSQAQFANQFGAGFVMKTTGLDAMETTEDTIGHGTLVAGIIAGKRHGIAKNAQLHPIRIADPIAVSPSLIMPGASIFNALDKLRIDLCKTGVVEKPSLVVLSATTERASSSSLKDAIDEAMKCGIVVVGAAGNQSDEAGKFGPADVKGVITAAAFNAAGLFASYSNYGDKVTILAPGSNIVSAVTASLEKSGVSAVITGTSAAAAHVAGVAAQIMEEHADSIRGQKNAPDFVLKLLVRNASSGLVGLPPKTPDLALRSPYGTGVTLDADEKDKTDGCNDAVSLPDCPADSTCDVPRLCKNTKRQRCCDGFAGADCQRGVRCENGVCISCGQLSERCCGSESCGDSLVCKRDVCVCGDRAQPCCGGDRCGSDRLACAPDPVMPSKKTCQTCGGASQPCCVGSMCDGGLTCSGGRCVACGGPPASDGTSQLCCAGGTCDASDVPLACVRNKDGMGRDTCEACGLANGQPCCTGAACPGSNLVCGTDGYCKSCGRTGQACCSGGTPCRGDLACVDHLDPRGKTCEGGGTCSVRCRDGEVVGLGRQETANDCIEAGRQQCDVNCGTGNKLARARYQGSVVMEDTGECGNANQACCQNEEDLGTCKGGKDCKPLTMVTPKCGKPDQHMYTCK